MVTDCKKTFKQASSLVLEYYFLIFDLFNDFTVINVCSFKQFEIRRLSASLIFESMFSEIKLLNIKFDTVLIFVILWFLPGRMQNTALAHIRWLESKCCMLNHSLVFQFNGKKILTYQPAFKNMSPVAANKLFL